jgi:hypothetical protein
MSTDDVSPLYTAGRMEELQRENEQLKEQVRKLAVQQTVTRGAVMEAAHEREATARMAHQVAVEERTTRAAVAATAGNLNLSVILQVIHLFLLLILMIGLFVWLPREMENRIRPTVVTPQPGGPVVVPGR